MTVEALIGGGILRFPCPNNDFHIFSF